MYSLICTLKQRPSSQVWDLVSGLLYQFHSQGIEEGEEPAPEGERALTAANEFELALEPGVLSPPEFFSAYFHNIRDAEKAQRAIEPVLEHLTPVYSIQEVEEKDYAEIWKQNFQPMAIEPFWLVRAPFHPSHPTKDIKELIIEPGMAFGTGSHETTRGCLELLALAVTQASLGPSSVVLDFGCGSGILAIALKKLNIETVYAIDIDPLAIDGTLQNAERNQVEVQASLTTPQMPPLDGIVANILKNTLLDFSESFLNWLKPNGFLILSGLLAEQEEAILEQYQKLGFKVQKRLLNNNWVSLWLLKSLDISSKK